MRSNHAIASVVAIASVTAAFLTGLRFEARAQSPQAPARSGPQADTAPAWAASVYGRVIAADNDAPLTRAIVRLFVPPPARLDVPVVATDDEGRYEYNWLAPGSYTLTASKSGYVTLSFGQRRPGEAGRSIQIVAGQRVHADFVLPRGGLIVARIADDLGEPIAGVPLRAMQRRYFYGESQLVAVGAQGVVTNGAGEARFPALPPGDYFVVAGVTTPGAAVPAAGSGRVFAPTYFPGTTSVIEAQRVTVGLGQQADVRFSLVAVRPARLSGTIRTSEGSPFTTAQALLNSPGSATGRNMMPRADGTFTLSNVLPGEYVIDVTPNGQTGRVQEFASMPLRVTGDDVTGLVVTSGPGGTARGRVVFDTGAPPSALKPGSLPVFAVTSTRKLGPPQGRPPTANDWSFSIAGLSGPVVFRLNPAPAASLVSGPAATAVNGFYVKAVMLDGKDITDTPLDFSGGRSVEGLQVIVTKTRTTLAGTAVDGKGAVTGEFSAVVFPQSREEWTPQSSRIAASRPDQRGRFTISGLPPGDYFAVAVEYLEVGSERDPELLARLMDKATRLTLAAGESKLVRLTRME